MRRREITLLIGLLSHGVADLCLRFLLELGRLWFRLWIWFCCGLSWLLWLRLEFSEPGCCRRLFVLVCWFLCLGWLNGGLCRLGLPLTDGAMLQALKGQVVIGPLSCQFQHPAVAAGGRGGVLKAIEVDVGLQQQSAGIIRLLC